MNVEVKEAWVAALRSGKYKQGGGALRKDDAFCCLGVLCDISGLGSWNGGTYEPMGDHRADSSCIYLPREVVEWAGVSSWNPALLKGGERITLASMNDGGSTFGQIADTIERDL